MSLDHYSRHDAGDGKQLSYQVGQVTVHEDEEGLNLAHLPCEARGEGCHHAKQEPEQHATQAHHKEPGHAQKHIRGIHHWQLSHMVEEVIQHLRETNKQTTDLKKEKKKEKTDIKDRQYFLTLHM